MISRIPVFSILTPVFNPPIDAFEKCVKSVLDQEFTDWEWCLVDDAAERSTYAGVLRALADSDPRIRYEQRKTNGGISAASNDAAAMANGRYLCLLDHDDMLHPQALTEIARAIEADSSIDYLYTDEDKIDSNNNHYDVFLKPSWSPERLRSQNYCCHLSVIRKSLFEEVGGFRSEFDGSQDYDLVLRATEQAKQIHHIPKVLYHWRAVAGSTASATSEKPYAALAAQRAVEEHLCRVGIEGNVLKTTDGYHRINRACSKRPLVSIIIPTRGDSKLVRGSNQSLVLRSVDSILANQACYPNIEIVVVADTATPSDVIDQLNTSDHVRVIEYPKPFNFSDKCNLGVIDSRGDVIVLLNDDTEVITGDWLATLVPLALEPDIGIVGPMLILEDGRIQSAGHANNPSPHNFRAGHTAQQAGEFGILAIARECSGVTGAAMIMRRDVYTTMGGMSLKFANCFNDVDFCFKVLEAGLRIIWTPHARLFHFESVTRDPTVPASELFLLKRRWGRMFDNDRFCRIN